LQWRQIFGLIARLATFAFFGAGIVVMTACSRTVFAMSRDARFPAHRLLRRVNPRTHTPVPATILIFVLAVVLMVALPGAALLKLIEASTILPAIINGFTVVPYLAVRKRLDRKKGAFDLGRFELPVAIGALVWSVAALFALVSPPAAIVPVLVVGRLSHRGSAVLPAHADIRPPDAGNRAGRCQRVQALTNAESGSIAIWFQELLPAVPVRPYSSNGRRGVCRRDDTCSVTRGRRR
jgi:amino acid transporter